MIQDRHKATPAAYLILEQDHKILLMRRFSTGYEDGNYSLPAGHLEIGETPSECIIREAKEEIGVTVERVDFMTAIYELAQDLTGDRVDIFFKANKWYGEVRICETDKCDALEWFSLDQLPDNMVDKVREAINNYQNNKAYAERK